MARQRDEAGGGSVPRALVPRSAPVVRSTRARDLALLPAGSVVVDADGDCAQAAPSGSWWWMGSEEPVTLDDLVRDAVWPVSVVWLPTKAEHLDPAYWTGAVPAVGGVADRSGRGAAGRSARATARGWRRWWVVVIVVPVCLLVGLAAGLALSALLT